MHSVTVVEPCVNRKSSDVNYLFRHYLNEVVTEDVLTHDPVNARVAIKRFVYDLYVNRPELALKEMEKNATHYVTLHAAQLDKIRTETDLAEKRYFEEAEIRRLTAQKLRKEIEGNVVEEVDIGLNNPTLVKMLALSENKARNKKKT